MSRGSIGFASLCWCLLFVFTTTIHAARPAHLRTQPSPEQILLPPGGFGAISGAPLPQALGEHKFTLRHVYHHGIQQYPHLHRYVDVPTNAKLQVTGDYGANVEEAPTDLTVRSQTMNIQRMAKRNNSDIDALLDYAYYNGQAAELPATAWTEDVIAGPNITDKKTILTFARMAANAYVFERGDGEWQPVKGGFNYTDDFGWEADGLRGHIFADETNKTVVIGLKGTSTILDSVSMPRFGRKSSHIDEISGTSPALFDGADTTGNDKLNDNLFGSCCCAQGGRVSWKQVCDCMTGTYSCNSTCLVQSLREKSHYYSAVRDLYSNVTLRYPNSDVWISGHSLGGVVSALLGLTYGLPTMTFEAFPDAMAAKRLGLPTPPGYKIGAHQTRARTGIYHWGHTADPIYMGRCNGALDWCSVGGYAFQGLCHTGQTCTYDTVTDLGWRVSLGYHKIVNVIRDVIKKYDTVPTCEADVDCQDCYLWSFYESNGTESSTTTSPHTSTTHTRTRTATCQTPGWWGCLDETTTTTMMTTTSSVPTTTSSSTTSTCKTPGWFGCLDETTTTTTTSIRRTSTPTASATATETCNTPGWFGECYDDSTTIPPTSMKPSPTATTTIATETDTCTAREWFGLICVDPSPTSNSSPRPTHSPHAPRRHCTSRHWYGICKQWREENIGDAKNDL